MLKNYNEILEKKSMGLCNSCNYGFDKCIEDGKAFCNKSEKEVINNGEEKSV